MTSIEPTSTESEKLFERFCAANGISCQPIECDGKKADYEVVVCGNRIIAELKQINPNESDDVTWNDGRNRGAVAAWGNSDHRVRLKIQEARKQLKARSEGKLPTLLVIFDNGTFAGTDGTDIKTAMFGDEKVVVSIADHRVASVSALHAGGNRRFSADSNTSISAIALMYGDKPRLSIFHNHFASITIDPDWIRLDDVKHFALNQSVYEWNPV
jgi:hypothetical protein